MEIKVMVKSYLVRKGDEERIVPLSDEDKENLKKDGYSVYNVGKREYTAVIKL